MAHRPDIDELPDQSTDGLARGGGDPRAIWTRRGFLVVLGSLVVAGGVGLLGVQDAHRTVTDEPWELALDYPALARPGLDAEWTLTVRRTGGITRPVQLSASVGYFGLYEAEGFRPTPREETLAAGAWLLTFDPPPAGGALTVSYEGSIQTGYGTGARGAVSVIDDGVPRATVRFRTLLLP